MSTPSEKSNLARIRENQRRSRARRREYVQELEQRLRVVEIQGIEASAEIQVVARKVAEENKKLRVLLNNNGIKNDAIENFLASGITQSPRGLVGPRALASSSCCGGAVGSSSSRNHDVHELEQLLIPRRPSWCDIPSSSDMVGGDERAATTSDTILVRSTREQQQQQQLPLSPVGSSSLAMYHDGTNFSDHSSSRNSIPDDSGFAQLSVSGQHQQGTLSPTMSIARSSTDGDHHQHHHAHPHHHHHQSRYFNTAYPDTHNASPQEMGYSYGMEPLHSPFHQQQHTPQPHHHHHQHISSHSYSPSRSRDDSAHAHAHSPISPSTTANSCSMTANVISSMVGADPFQVRATLGCPPGVDCVVDNNTVSNAIDQLTASALGVYK
ncbi:hypothetical protein V8F06_007055 [Rhypophila decipiens]